MGVGWPLCLLMGHPAGGGGGHHGGYDQEIRQKDIFREEGVSCRSWIIQQLNKVSRPGLRSQGWP